ncbi:MAG: hypothetical protein ACI9O4_000215 [Chitinophagales bacterium]|jgi:hypothetical protein
MALIYQNSLGLLPENMMEEFFVAWPNPPSMQTLFAILKNSA